MLDIVIQHASIGDLRIEGDYVTPFTQRWNRGQESVAWLRAGPAIDSIDSAVWRVHLWTMHSLESGGWRGWA